MEQTVLEKDEVERRRPVFGDLRLILFILLLSGGINSPEKEVILVLGI